MVPDGSQSGSLLPAVLAVISFEEFRLRSPPSARRRVRFRLVPALDAGEFVACVCMEPVVKAVQLLPIQPMDAADVKRIEYEPPEFFVLLGRMGEPQQAFDFLKGIVVSPSFCPHDYRFRRLFLDGLIAGV